jgi:hypothetical protein
MYRMPAEGGTAFKVPPPTSCIQIATSMKMCSEVDLGSYYTNRERGRDPNTPHRHRHQLSFCLCLLEIFENGGGKSNYRRSRHVTTHGKDSKRWMCQSRRIFQLGKITLSIGELWTLSRGIVPSYKGDARVCEASKTTILPRGVIWDRRSRRRRMTWQHS